jgi:menaquinone-dependent protoporphyrinogen oxidase
LFSSGPVGNPPRPAEEDAVDVTELLAATHAREHRLFGGALDQAALGFRERAVMRAVGAHDGDARDWDAIRDWAGAIAETLRAAQVAA